MATTNLTSYELVVVFTPVLADDDFRNAQKKFSDFITTNGGTISHEEPWGMRAMAYPIQKKTTGLYWLLQYTAPSDVNTRLEVQMNRDETVMRHMITRLDKYSLEYNDRRRRKASEKPAETRAEQTENAAPAQA